MATVRRAIALTLRVTLAASSRRLSGLARLPFISRSPQSGSGDLGDGDGREGLQLADGERSHRVERGGLPPERVPSVASSAFTCRLMCRN